MGVPTGQAPLGGKLSFNVPAVAQATDQTIAFLRMPFTGTIVSVNYAANADITGANTNTRRVALINKGLDGNGATVVAELQFNSGVNAADYDEKPVTLSGTVANLDVAEGAVLAWFSDSVGTGLADPGGAVVVEIARD